MKALIIQPAFLGDAVISLALAEELHRLSPDTSIAYLVRPEAASVIKYSPSVHSVFSFDKYNSESGISGIKKKAVELNAEKFDVVFTLHSSKRTRMLIRMLDAPIKIGYGKFQELTIGLEEVVEQQTSRAIRLLLPLFPDANLSNLPKLVPDASLLPKEALSLPRPIVAIASDSVWQTKQWGTGNYRRLIDALKSKNVSIILIGSKESDAFNKSPNLLYNNELNLLAKTTLPEVISLIAHSDLLISNDSAPVHIATATGTKSLVLFGPTVPEFGFAPPPQLGMVVQAENLWCRPCASHGSNECPIHTHECMTSISLDDVLKKAVSLLSTLGIGAESRQ
jgi:heptosyltransferase-2